MRLEEVMMKICRQMIEKDSGINSSIPREVDLNALVICKV
jgi:hypothetical protein